MCMPGSGECEQRLLVASCLPVPESAGRRLELPTLAERQGTEV